MQNRVNSFFKVYLEIWRNFCLSACLNHYLEDHCHRNKLVIDVSLANKLMLLEFEIYYNRSAKFLSLKFPPNSSQLIDICRYFILTFPISLTLSMLKWRIYISNCRSPSFGEATRTLQSSLSGSFSCGMRAQPSPIRLI